MPNFLVLGSESFAHVVRWTGRKVWIDGHECLELAPFVWVPGHEYLSERECEFALWFVERAGDALKLAAHEFERSASKRRARYMSGRVSPAIPARYGGV